MKKKFDKAAKDIQKAAKDPGNDMKLRLYAHYKQGTLGDRYTDWQSRHSFTRTRGNSITTP